MSSLRTLPRMPWLPRLSLALASALVALGGAVMISWVAEIQMVQGMGELAPMRMNTALSFFVLGAVLLAIERGHGRFVWFALIPILIGTVAMIQDAGGWNFGLDELLVDDPLTPPPAWPGRTSPPASVSMTAAGLLLIWRSVNPDSRRRTMIFAVISSVITSVGVATLLGYLLALPGVYDWGTQSSTGPLTALALIVLGTSLLTLAWRDSQAAERGAMPLWVPVPVTLAAVTLTLVLWEGLRERELVYEGTVATEAISDLAAELRTEMEQQISAAGRLAVRWGGYGSDAEALWETDAITHLADTPALQSVALLDTRYHTHWLFPIRGNEPLIGYDHSREPLRQDTLEEAERSLAPAISRSVEVSGLGPGFVIYAPVLQDGEIQGYLSVEYIYRRLLQQIEQRQQFAGRYLATVEIGGEVVYDPAGRATEPSGRLTFESSATMFDRRVRIRLEPSGEAADDGRRLLPRLVLAAGLGISALLGLSVHLGRNAFTNLRDAERSTHRLHEQNEERRRVEAMLQLADERLRLAVESTLIGIFDWSFAPVRFYYSPSLWSMLGYPSGHPDISPEGWQSLIHPDDVDGYLAALESQKAGESFIEPEFRVRTGDGEWRWIYQRAKVVARDGQGLPTRILGTMQDISQRKGAEDALRVSQSTARKLSLVASRTDNLVIITSPQGEVEWANESFTRVLEYPLGAVLGQNPTHFLVGPDTDPETIRQVQTAMAGGEGVTCDVLIYSRSGRRYHLHLEVQPVLNDAGKVETFIVMMADITARVETETALRRAKQEADAASRAKSEFLASMSHEIRTPMNGVMGMTSLLLETPLSPEQRDYINTVRVSGENLLTIINDILDFSKIESGRMELEHLPFDLAACVEETLDLFAAEAAGKGVELAYVMEEDVPGWIVGDATRLRQVLVNLVNNAVKFTPAGQVDVVIRRAPAHAGVLDRDAGSKLEFTIRDTGIGIPPDRVDRLFKPFSQIDSSTTRKYGGTGLGLAICHRLCGLMGGEIWVESLPGAGSRFIFTMLAEPMRQQPGPGWSDPPAPLRAGTVLCVESNPVNLARLQHFLQQAGLSFAGAGTAAEAMELLAGSRTVAAAIIDSRVAGDDGSSSAFAAEMVRRDIPILVLLPAGHATGHTGTPFGRVATVAKPLKTATLVRGLQGLFQPEPAGSTPREHTVLRTLGQEIPLNVLLVEDNPVNQKVALRFLDRLGYKADAAGNGREALARVQNGDYHLVLMDLQMPEMDGLEASRRIRQTIPSARQPRIVALTANALQGDRDLCMAAGMDDYITKPLKLHELVAVIRRHFDESPTQDARR